MTFFSGTLLFFLGIIGEYVGRVYEETKSRPHYIVGRVRLTPELQWKSSTVENTATSTSGTGGGEPAKKQSSICCVAA